MIQAYQVTYKKKSEWHRHRKQFSTAGNFCAVISNDPDQLSARHGHCMRLTSNMLVAVVLPAWTFARKRLLQPIRMVIRTLIFTGGDAVSAPNAYWFAVMGPYSVRRKQIFPGVCRLHATTHVSNYKASCAGLVVMHVSRKLSNSSRNQAAGTDRR